MRDSRELSINRPDSLTKILRVQKNVGTNERWVRFSSNFLNPFGFVPGTQISRELIGAGEGFRLRVNPAGGTKVYRRSYAHRRNNPFETQIDLKVQGFINDALPGWTDRVHYTVTPGVIEARPLRERAFHIAKKLREMKALEAFMSCSAGIDSACFRSAGFSLGGLIEWRPPEKRDKLRDLSETGILTSSVNNNFRWIFNEDITQIDFENVRKTVASSPPALVHVSISCDDFSTAKADSIKKRHIADGTTTKDMVYDALRLVETLEPAVAVFENVPGFANSDAGVILEARLRRWGYFVKSGVFSAPSFSGLTKRRRYLAVASIFPDYEFPTPSITPGAGEPWAAIADQIESCNDAAHTTSVLDGIATKRITFLTPNCASAPTTTKSQSRHAKDATYFKTNDGRILFPNEESLRRLQSIPTDFSFKAVSQEIAIEQIGQGIDWKMHHAIAVAVFRHLQEHQSSVIVPAARIVVRAPEQAVAASDGSQLEFGM